VDYNEESDDEPVLAVKTKTDPAEFGGLFGNIILTLLFPMLVILVKIAIKTVIKIFQFYNFSMILIIVFFTERKFNTFSSWLFKIS